MFFTCIIVNADDSIFVTARIPNSTGNTYFNHHSGLPNGALSNIPSGGVGNLSGYLTSLGISLGSSTVLPIAIR